MSNSLSLGFSRQEYWSELSDPPLGNLPDPGIEPACPISPALAGGFFTTSATWLATHCLSTNPVPIDLGIGFMLGWWYLPAGRCQAYMKWNYKFFILSTTMRMLDWVYISRQEHWSRLPFPSPMHESEKWKWSCSVASDPQRPHGLQPSRLLHPWDFPGKRTGVGCHCLLWYHR